MSALRLYELIGAEGERYSLFSWRAKLALKHKKLDWESAPVLLSDKETIAFSGGRTVPILVHDGGHVRDSLAIARWLEATYPDRPSLFDGPGGEMLTITLNNWVDRTVIPTHMPLVARDIHQRVDPRDRDHFRSSIEAAFGASLEELERRARERHPAVLARSLEPVRATLKRQPFLGGDHPVYADYIVASPLLGARVVSPNPLLAADDHPLTAWFDRMLDLFGGFARAAPAAR